MATSLDHYAVVGHPVSHSLSPRIHRHFAAQTQQALDYSAIELPEDGFDDGVRGLQQRGFRGLNVTVPFKREAWELCDCLSDRARDAGAVNTLSFDDNGDIAGDNTDGIGLIRDLTINLQLNLESRRILILGAGGAVRGVLGPLLERSPLSITLANRTPAKAESLATDFAGRGRLEVREFAALDETPFDLVINGTAAGIRGEVPPVPGTAIGSDSVCYDMMYNIETNTAFVDWALDQGAARAHDGLGMLVEQAAAAFAIWRRISPETAEVIRQLRRS